MGPTINMLLFAETDETWAIANLEGHLFPGVADGIRL
jgi:hypothetical protein